MSGTVAPTHPERVPVPVLDAATVMLLRDGPDGIEVCMMRRNPASGFVGGAHVFPGGAVDAADRSPDAARSCRGLDDAMASRLAGQPAGGLAFWVAAIRETFEEAGILLARDADGRPVSFGLPDVAARFAGHRRAVDTGAATLVEVCRREDLTLDAGALSLFSRWVTPLGAPRRYDTRFFVAVAPDGQEARHDDRELVDTAWLTPAEALRRHRAGEIVLILPTERSLEALARFERAADVVAHAQRAAMASEGIAMVPEGPDGVRITLPGDP